MESFDTHRTHPPIRPTVGHGSVAASEKPVVWSARDPVLVVLPDLRFAPAPETGTSRPVPSEAPPIVDIVLPVHNEEGDLAASTRSLRSYLDSVIPFPTVVTIVDNGSTDTTYSIASELALELEGVRAIRIETKGRGSALRCAWSRSEARVVAYMDVDLSTSLNALLPLIAPVVSGHAPVAIGTRLAHGSRIVRSQKREVISRLYNLVLKVALRSKFTDAQCGFKAVDAEVARSLMSDVQDNEWFFDTELLVRAQRRGIRIDEIPVDWVENTDSRVQIVRTAVQDLKGVVRLMLQRTDRHLTTGAPVKSMRDTSREIVHSGAEGQAAPPSTVAS